MQDELSEEVLIPMLRTTIIGERIRTARIAAHLTQQELAGTSFSKSYISAIERSKMAPSIQALQQLAARLAVPISYLLGENVRSNETIERSQQAHEEALAQLLGEAESLLQQGRFEEAIASFEQLGRKNRTRCAHEAYARFLAAQGRFQDAYEQMQKALH